MRYRLYGLTVDSHDLFLEMAPAKETNVDVRIKNASPRISLSSPPSWFMNWTLPGGEKWLSCAKTDEGYLLRFNELADLTIDRIGSEIVCMPKPGIPEDTIQHLLLDQVIPLVINLRGGEALHASAILTSHGVVAFAGPAGSGKSTITGSLMKMGYPFVSDDCLTLREKDQTIYAIPAYPGLRLWDDAQEYLFGEKGNKKSVAHYTSKLRVDIEEGLKSYSLEPKPFVRLYDIVNSSETDETSDIAIEKLSPRDSFMALVRCAFRLDITDQNMLTRQFHFLEKVTSSNSVLRLSFPRNFRFLPDVQKAILNDLKDLEECIPFK
jgi:hypothetical protein